MELMDFNNTANCTEPRKLSSVYPSPLLQYMVFVPFIVYLARIALPLWLIIGVPGSVLSFIVWSSKPMRSSSSIYLCALAILDLMFLLSQQLPFHINEFYDVNVMNNPVLCRITPVYNIWLQYLSPLLTLGFTIERYISICHPFRRKELCTVKRAIIVVTVMTTACFLLSLVQLNFYEYSDADQTCSEDPRIFNQTLLEHKFYSGWSKLTEVLFFAIAPLVILVFNILVLVQARKVINSRASTGQKDKINKSAATTATLLSVSFYQIGAVLPVTILLFVGLAIMEDEVKLPCDITGDEAARQYLASGDWPDGSVYFTYIAVSKTVDSLSVSHYAMKFVIYVVTGSRFRRELIHLCRVAQRLLPCCNGRRGASASGRRDLEETPERRLKRREERLKRRYPMRDCAGSYAASLELMTVAAEQQG